MFNLFDNDQLQFIGSAIFISIVGGIANWLMSDDHTIFQFIVAIFLAGFAGFLVGELCLEFSVSQAWSFFFCGSAGLCAEMVLKVARRTVLKKLSIFTDSPISDMKESDIECMNTEEEKEKSTLEKFIK